MGVRRPPLRDVSAHPTNVLELKQNQSTPSVQQLGPKRCHRFVVVRCFNARSAGSKFADVYFCKAVFIDIAKELRQAGVDGLYIDQLASYYPQPCFSRAGGDSAGTGWADGGRKLFSDVAEALGPDTAIFSESNAEACERRPPLLLNCRTVFSPRC